ncbi:MAG: protein BatD [Paludibacteraceae bacterium]|nr:protein BatD [Paludibacteraceae bacterium]
MTKRHKIVLLLSALLLLPFFGSRTWADDVSFTASAPKQVVMGKPFQLTFSVNHRAKDLRAPEMPEFDIIAGPYSSQSSSTSFVNGQRTSTFSLTYTYTLMPRKEGSFTIDPASIVVGGDTYRSNALKVTVLPADETPAASNSGPQQSAAPTTSQSSSNRSGGDIFIKTQVSKTKVHEQECILLSYKLYFAGVDVAQFTNNTKLPEFKGFLKQELEQGDVQTELEHYNGRNYQTAILYRTLLFPQKSGDIEIEPANFEAVLRVQNRQQIRSIFDDFFATYSNVTKPLTAPGITIHVQPLPAGKPAGFSGGVGSFSLSSSISSNSITTNDALTVKLSISGKGNMKMVKTPSIDWPDGFEVYDPKVTNNFKSTTAGVSGSKDIEYLAIARAAGDYVIPAITFSYYDTNDNTYKTLRTEEYTVHVARGAGETDQTVVTTGTYTNKEDIQKLGTDIRYIETKPLPAEERKGAGLTGLWWLMYLVPALLSLLLFVLFRKQIRDNQDLTKVRYRKANKVAQKRLKKAAKLMNAGQDAAFYEEIERAAWTYLSDRLSIPQANLTKENIADILRSKNVSDERIQEVTDVLSTAEFARYAPAAAGSKEDLYNATAKLIDNLESTKI